MIKVLDDDVYVTYEWPKQDNRDVALFVPKGYWELGGLFFRYNANEIRIRDKQPLLRCSVTSFAITKHGKFTIGKTCESNPLIKGEDVVNKYGYGRYTDDYGSINVSYNNHERYSKRFNDLVSLSVKIEL